LRAGKPKNISRIVKIGSDYLCQREFDLVDDNFCKELAENTVLINILVIQFKHSNSMLFVFFSMVVVRDMIHLRIKRYQNGQHSEA
jgi:hypothetical protein